MRQRVALNSETRAAAVRTASAETATWWGQDAESLTRAVVEFMAADRTYVGRLSVPVSAVVAMRAALHLRVLEHEDAPFFQHVMEAVKGALEKDRAAAGEERAVECDAFWCTWSAGESLAPLARRRRW